MWTTKHMDHSARGNMQKCKTKNVTVPCHSQSYSMLFLVQLIIKYTLTYFIASCEIWGVCASGPLEE